MKNTISLILLSALCLAGQIANANTALDILATIVPGAGCPAYRCYEYQVVNTYPHDQLAFTEGLAFGDGFLYEGTGLYGASTLRKVELESGAVLQVHVLPADYFGEGITIFGDRIIRLTWRSRVGFVYDKDSFALLHEFHYPTEGWGITHDGEHLIMSDGTSTLRFLDPQTFREVRHIQVFDTEGLVIRINELEYVKGQIYANIWPTERIAMISPRTGRVTGWIELMDLGPHAGNNVLNGIAYDSETERLFVTGKRWPKIFEIELLLQSPGDLEPDGRVNMVDFAVFAAAWLSSPADANWNPVCDISRLPDNIIDVLDLAVLAEYWLRDFRALVQWDLDEAEGSIARDGADGYDGTVNGASAWADLFPEM